MWGRGNRDVGGGVHEERSLSEDLLLEYRRRGGGVDIVLLLWLRIKEAL